MDKIDDILGRLSAQQPKIDNPLELTDRIMANLPERGESPQQPEWNALRTYPFVKTLRIVSSIAAVWLIGLFLYVNKPVIESQKEKSEVPHYYTDALPAGSTLRDVYTSRRQQDKLISYTQLRTKYYEKN